MVHLSRLRERSNCAANRVGAPSASGLSRCGDTLSPTLSRKRARERTADLIEAYAAKSATTASSTGNPLLVTRSRPVASTVIAPSSRSSAMRLGSSGRPESAV
ncbi:hypothetical protein ACVWXO_002514 [Bradyrhizobium sp. LM2.7]